MVAVGENKLLVLEKIDRTARLWTIKVWSGKAGEIARDPVLAEAFLGGHART